MSDEQMSPEDQEELDQLANMVVESLAKGEKPADISKQLVAGGWEQEAADDFVRSIQMHLASAAAQEDEGGGAMGWLVWIGAILFINFLSWVFGWPFWIY